MEEPKGVKCHNCDTEMEPAILYTHFLGKASGAGVQVPKVQ